MDVISRNLGCAGDGRETSRLAMQRSEVPLATLYRRIMDLLGGRRVTLIPGRNAGALSVFPERMKGAAWALLQGEKPLGVAASCGFASNKG